MTPFGSTLVRFGGKWYDLTKNYLPNVLLMRRMSISFSSGSGSCPSASFFLWSGSLNLIFKGFFSGISRISSLAVRWTMTRLPRWSDYSSIWLTKFSFIGTKTENLILRRRKNVIACTVYSMSDILQILNGSSGLSLMGGRERSI